MAPASSTWTYRGGMSQVEGYESPLFYDANKFKRTYRGGISSVTNMYRMFNDADAFDADISRWDTSLVTNMNKCFLLRRRKSRFHNWARQQLGVRRGCIPRHRAAPTTVHPPRGFAKTTRARVHATRQRRRRQRTDTS